MSLTINDKLIVLKSFFDTQVDCYILADLKNLMNVPLISGKCGGCTIPAAMLMLSSMEMFGTHLTANPGTTNTGQYSKKFINDYIPEISANDRDSLISDYRNKVMHVFFPKVAILKMYGVTKVPASNDLLDKTDPLRPILNIVELRRLFELGVTRLKNKIFIVQDPTTIDTFYDNIAFPTSGTTSSTTAITTNPLG